MANDGKHKGIIKELIQKNEEIYGEEIRLKYGREALEKSNQTLYNLTEAQWLEQENLSKQINALLKKATEIGDPTSAEAQEICDLHRQWLNYFWEEGVYSKSAHLSLGWTYVSDERFSAHYNNIVEGGAKFLWEALQHYCEE